MDEDEQTIRANAEADMQMMLDVRYRKGDRVADFNPSFSATHVPREPLPNDVSIGASRP